MNMHRVEHELVVGIKLKVKFMIFMWDLCIYYVIDTKYQISNHGYKAVENVDFDSL